MTLFDYGVLSVIGISVVMSVVRGLVRELLALAGWVIAFVVASMFSGTVAGWMPAAITSTSLRVLLAFAALFIGVLILMTLFAIALRGLIRSAGLGAEDRLLGALFGFARGMLIVMIFVLAAGLTALPRQPVWGNAVLSAPLEALAVQVKQWLPKHVAQYINYD